MLPMFQKEKDKAEKKKNSGYRESQVVLTKKYGDFDEGTQDAYLYILHLKSDMNLLRSNTTRRLLSNPGLNGKLS
jgi:hypothetical protein